MGKGRTFKLIVNIIKNHENTYKNIFLFYFFYEMKLIAKVFETLN